MDHDRGCSPDQSQGYEFKFGAKAETDRTGHTGAQAISYRQRFGNRHRNRKIIQALIGPLI